MPKMRQNAFSLVELLIVLAIMGFVVAGTIPAVLQMSASSQNDKYTAMAKDTSFMVLSAYERLRMGQTSVSLYTNINSLSPYMNYVSLSSSASQTMNHPPTGAFLSNGQNCGTQFLGANWCYNLHNGGVLWFNDVFYFGGQNTTNAIWFNFDPDGSGSAKSLQVFLTYDGRIYTVKNLPVTMTSGYIFSTLTQSATTQDASWFNGF